MFNENIDREKDTWGALGKASWQSKAGLGAERLKSAVVLFVMVSHGLA